MRCRKVPRRLAGFFEAAQLVFQQSIFKKTALNLSVQFVATGGGSRHQAVPTSACTQWTARQQSRASPGSSPSSGNRSIRGAWHSVHDKSYCAPSARTRPAPRSSKHQGAPTWCCGALRGPWPIHRLEPRIRRLAPTASAFAVAFAAQVRQRLRWLLICPYGWTYQSLICMSICPDI